MYARMGQLLLLALRSVLHSFCIFVDSKWSVFCDGKIERLNFPYKLSKYWSAGRF